MDFTNSFLPLRARARNPSIIRILLKAKPFNLGKLEREIS